MRAQQNGRSRRSLPAEGFAQPRSAASRPALGRSALAFFAVLAVAGCSSARIAERAAPEESLEAESPMKDANEQFKRTSGFGLDRQVLDNEGKPVTDEEVSRLLDWRVALPKSGRLALLEARAYREYYYCGSWGTPERTVDGSEWAVRSAAPEDVDTVKAELLSTNRFESVTTVPSIFLPSHADLGRCRYAAARANADLVLLYSKATRMVRYRNRLANFYPLIVGLLLPGEETVVVTRVEGALVDARTGRVFAVAQGAGRGQDSSSPLSASDEGRHQLLDETERDALKKLAENLRADLEASGNRNGK